LKAAIESDLGRVASIQGKNLGTLLAWGYEQQQVYVASEALEGASLRQIIDAKKAQGGVVGLAHGLVLLGHAANAMEKAYAKLAHGGINPTSIRLNNAGRVRLMNLGLCRALPGLTRGNPATAPYVAPEVAAGSTPSPAADVFSLGAVLYELVTGHVPSVPPWPASQVNAELPKAIDGILDRALASLPEARYTQPAHFIAELAGLSQTKAETAAPVEMPPKLAVGKAFSVADAVRLSEEYERWLVQKDNLDYGPFSLAQVMAQMEKGVFSGDDFIVDADSGDRQKIKEHPQLVEFCRITERKLEAQRRAKAEQVNEHVERRKSTWTFLIIGLAVLAVGGGLTFYMMNRKATQNDALAARVSESDIDAFLKDVKVEFAKPHRSGGGKRGTGPGGGGVSGRNEDFVNNMDFGDVSQGGGDAILDEGIIDKVMQGNYRKLVPCIMRSGVRSIEIDFVIAPIGKVVAAAANGQKKGALPMCVLSQMQSFGFPSWKGKKTIASWSMSLR
jgi:serine/threonine-protein kinase